MIRLWWLSCEDMMIPEGTCEQCELKEECSIVRKKLYGKNGGVRSRAQVSNNNKVDISVAAREAYIPT